MNFNVLHYTAMGDSIAWGQDGISKQRMEKPYCEIVKELLGFKSVTNLGIGWSTTAHLETCKCHNFHNAHDPMCERTNTIPLESDIISLNGGINDRGLNIPLGSFDSRDTTTYLGAFNVLIDKTIERCPKAWIFVISLTPTKVSYQTGVKNEIGLTWDDYNNAMQKLAKLRGIDLLVISKVECEEIMVDLSKEESDGVHLSQNCIKEVLAPLIADFIRRHYENG